MRKLVLTDAMLVLGLGLIVAGMGINLKNKNEPKKLEIIKAGALASPAPVNSVVLVDISGEVIKPGVYKLGGEARINDVLVAAGGLTAKADREWVEANINRAEKIRDGMKIFIPSINQNLKIKDQNLIQNSKILGTENKIISLNNAGLVELESLSGIGPAMGQRIIDYRTKNGGFKSVEEVKLVDGIGEKLYEKIKDFVTL